MDRSALGFRNLWINRTQEINQSCPLPSDAVAPGQSIQVELALGIAAEGSIEDATVASVQTLGGDGTLSPTEEPAVVSTAECLAGFARSSIRMPEGDARDEIRVSVTHTAS